MFAQYVRKCDFSRMAWRPADGPSVLGPHFALRFRAAPAELDEGRLIHAWALRVEVSDKAKAPMAEREFVNHKQNYLSVTAPDGTCHVMECSLWMECDSSPWRIGFPLALAGSPEHTHEYAVLFDGVRFQVFSDGVLMDEEWPEGEMPRDYEGGGGAMFSVFHPGVRDLAYTNDLSGIRRESMTVMSPVSAMFYTPFGFNAWIGDVAPITYKGRFHIFYLHDRRHHGSRRGKGAHVFWHLSTDDLRNWTEHGPVLELTENWQSMGTGNAFVMDGKLHLAFGWHTKRSIPWPQRARRLFIDNLKRLGHTGEYDESELGDLKADGASYAVSEDAIHFTQSHRLIHYLENPSIFVQPNGRLHLWQDGLWESDHLGSWQKIEGDFPPCGKRSLARNRLDCPTTFSLGGWEYFAVGFTGFWGRPLGKDGEWLDFTECGWSPYDGINVPMAADFQGRMLECGWIDGNDWGCCLIMRELISLGGGRLGKRWVAETLPDFGRTASVETSDIELPEAVTILLECELRPEDGRFSALFKGMQDGETLEFMLDPMEKRAQWSAEPGHRIPTFREEALAHPEYDSFDMFRYAPRLTRDFALESLTGLETPFTLRMLVHRHPKLDSTVVDVEIAGRHTMITQRRGLHAVSLQLTGNPKNLRMNW